MLIQETKECWEQLAPFRRKRLRCIDYTFGRQWNDIIEIDGRRLTEYEYILSEGNVPLKNNLIRRIVRNVIGVFRQRLPEMLEEEYTGELHEIKEQNYLGELFCRLMEEFLISGMAVCRKRLGERNGVNGIWTDIVSPANFFFNTDSRDFRGWDLNLVGQIHNVDLRDWCRAFVKSPDDYKRTLAIFNQGKRRLKITEVWKKEVRPMIMVHDQKAGYIRKFPEEESCSPKWKDAPQKWVMEEMWRYYFLTDDGTVIAEGDSPYIHRGHPFVMMAYPYLDGEIQSFVADMIDQQRYTNRLITLYDWVIRASAKGVLLLPEGAVEPSTLRDVANQWGRFNGVIVYRPDPASPEPRQINGSNNNLGISELLEIQLKMMEDVSGVNGILQGNTSGGNVSGELYNSQTTNALYSLSDFLESFRRLIHESSEKDRLLLYQTIGKFP